MAKLVGGVFTSHVPAIGGAIARGVQNEPYWKPFFDGFAPVRAWLQDARPDVAVVFYNDHGLNFFLDKMPTFALGTAQTYRNADEGWGIPQVAPFRAHEALSWHLLEQLVAADFDIVSCQEMQVDHAFTLPFQLLWPDGSRPVTVVPVCINTVLFPLPSAARCLALGRAVGRALAQWPGDERVLVIGSGGLSHQLEGTRAGHLNPAFDKAFMDSLLADEAWVTQFSINDLAREAGTQGLELLNWLAARGALAPAGVAVKERHRNYHIPISNTAAGLMLLQP